MNILQKKLKWMESLSNSSSLESNTWKKIWLLKNLFWDKIIKIQQNENKFIDNEKVLDLIHKDLAVNIYKKINFYKKAKELKDIFLWLWIEDKLITIRCAFQDIAIRINWVETRLDLDFDKDTMKFNSFWEKSYNSEIKKINKENLLEILYKYSPALLKNIEAKSIIIWNYTEKKIIDEFISVESIYLKDINKLNFYNELKNICIEYWKNRYPYSVSWVNEKTIMLFHEKYGNIKINFEEIYSTYNKISLDIWKNSNKTKEHKKIDYYLDENRHKKVNISIFNNSLNISKNNKNIFDEIYKIILDSHIIKEVYEEEN